MSWDENQYQPSTLTNQIESCGCSVERKQYSYTSDC